MEKYLPILESCPLFSTMTSNEILSVMNCIKGRIIRKDENEFILRVGEATREMGLVLSGSTLIIQEDIWAHRNIMSKCIPGDFFGETYAATAGSVLNISVIANEKCEILMISLDEILNGCANQCSHHHRLIKNLVYVLANKILILNSKITHMSKRTTRDKLLSYLSSEAIKQGKLSFNIPYDRQQLADFLCVERAAMSVELSKLQKEGYFTTKKKHFELRGSIVDV